MSKGNLSEHLISLFSKTKRSVQTGSCLTLLNTFLLRV